MRSGYKEGVGCKGKDSVLGGLPLSPLSVAQDDSDKVLRGDKCAPHPQPWQVALFEHGSCNCGGSRISPRAGCSLQPIANRGMKAWGPEGAWREGLGI